MPPWRMRCSASTPLVAWLTSTGHSGGKARNSCLRAIAESSQTSREVVAIGRSLEHGAGEG